MRAGGSEQTSRLTIGMASETPSGETARPGECWREAKSGSETRLSAISRWNLAGPASFATDPRYTARLFGASRSSAPALRALNSRRNLSKESFEASGGVILSDLDILIRLRKPEQKSPKHWRAAAYNLGSRGIQHPPSLMDEYRRHEAQKFACVSPDFTYLIYWANRFRFRIMNIVGRELERVAKEAAAVASNTQRPLGASSHAVIWNALERIRKSEVMSGCQRLVQLLTFVVEATLKGEANHLKETTIGVFVFGRAPDYDPKVDTIVRSQAWRLRGKLREYYASEGIKDPVIIDIPLGRYIPVFSLREPAAAAKDNRDM